MVQVVIKSLTRKGINASVLMCLRNARFKNFKDSILDMNIVSLYDGPVYFNCYPNLALTLDDPNIVKALTLNIASSSYHMEEGSEPLALIYHIYYRLLGYNFVSLLISLSYNFVYIELLAFRCICVLLSLE